MGKQSRKSFNNKNSEHIPCGYSRSIIWAFYSTEHKHILYREEDCTVEIFNKGRISQQMLHFVIKSSFVFFLSKILMYFVIKFCHIL